MRKWIKTTITTNQQANEMIELAYRVQPTIGAFDSETNGLHIVLARPFLFQFGFLHPTEPIGYSFAVDLQRQPDLARKTIQAWHCYAIRLHKYLAHNAKFDLHMLANVGLDYTEENVSDTMFYIRYAHDALTPKFGGPPLKLKEYTARYITADAKKHEHKLNVEKTAIAKHLNALLKKRMSECGRPPAKYGAASYTLGVLDKIFSDKIADWESLPTEKARQAYDDWLNLDVPMEIRHKVTGLVETEMIPYTWLNRMNVIEYAHYDIVYVLEVYEKLDPIVAARQNGIGIQIEEDTIFPWFYMERVGFATDVDYLKESRDKMKTYIQQQRQSLWDLTGEEFGTAQHAKTLQVLNNFGANLAGTNDDLLSLKKNELLREDPEHIVVQLISLVQELRTLEKWYSTYILRFLNNLHQTDRLYTTINQVGTVSGRVTSDFQQFPKGGIKDTNGEMLFHPRRLIKVSGEDYPMLLYLDYSQIELRFQAFYTILVGDPDLNLCRAYMPYECVDSNGVPFDYNNPEHIKAWRAEWYYKENPTKHWEPTDVHGATTEKAFGITPDHPDFHRLRYVGKTVNFAKNYGAQLGRIEAMLPQFDEEQNKRINDAYYAAFPGVKSYHNYCYDRAQMYSNTSNLFGTKYYGVSGHKLINLLVQGSAAFFLKLKIAELYKYSKEHKLKTRWQMQVHDELSWEVHKDDDPKHLFEFKRIMEDWESTLVPIVADMEISLKTWADKEEVNTLDEVQQNLSS